MTSKRFGLLAIVIAATVMWAIPTTSTGKSSNLRTSGAALKQATVDLGSAVESTVDKAVAKTDDALRTTRTKAAAKTGKATRATATDPARQPPLHGSDPHGQGGVSIVDTDPSNERPLASDPSGKASGEEAIVGRARGEKVNGAYHGHITILALLGNEVAGVDTAQGETKNGPLQPVQAGILDPLCTNTGMQVCLSVLTANSTSNATSSSNDFAIARASVLGLGVGAAESQGSISEDANCQTSTGTSKTANVTSRTGTAAAQAANSSSTSKSCRGAAPVVTNTSQVIGLGGVQVPIPNAGCANGVPDTVTGIPGILPIVCNAEDIAGAAAVREALDVYVLTVGSASLAKETTAASESFSVAPPAPETADTPQCSDGVDNDNDGVIDTRDPGCHSDGNANNAASFDPNDDNETNRSGGTGGSGDDDAQCSDGRDNDGDGKVDAKDPGCHTDGNANNPDSFDPDDDSEAGGDGGGGGAGGGGQTADASELPFTGTDVVGLTLAGLLLLAGGLLLRRREGTHAAL